MNLNKPPCQVKNQLISNKVKWFKLSSYNAAFFMIFQEFLRIFKYSSTYSSQKEEQNEEDYEVQVKTLNSMYSIWSDSFLLFLEMVAFTMLFWRWATLPNSILFWIKLLLRCLTLFVSTLKYTTLIWCCWT